MRHSSTAIDEGTANNATFREAINTFATVVNRKIKLINPDSIRNIQNP